MHLEALGTVGDGDAASDSSGAKEGTEPAEFDLKTAYKALKEIVEIAKKEGVEEPKSGDTAVKVGSGTDNK